MTGFLLAALGVLAVLGVTAVGDMVSEEVRDRLDHMPHAILRLAARRLEPELRVSLYEEVWLPDLAFHLKGEEARPVTRLYHGVCFAFGMLASARRSSRSVGSAALDGDAVVGVDSAVWKHLVWRRSAPGDGGIEVALTDGKVLVRLAPRLVLSFSPAEFQAFVRGARLENSDMP